MSGSLHHPLMAAGTGFPCRADLSCDERRRTRGENVAHEFDAHGYTHPAIPLPGADRFNARERAAHRKVA